MPATTSPDKIAKIEFQGGRCHFVADPRTVYAESARARGGDGRPLSRPVHLCRAGDRLARQQQHRRNRSSRQMRLERHPEPAWVVCGAGTGGTSATIGRCDPLPAAGHAPVRGGPRALGLPPSLGRPVRDHGRGAVLLHRGHRPAAGRALVQSRPGRPDDRGSGRGQPRRHARAGRTAGPALRRVDRDQPVGLCGRDLRDGGDAARPARSSRFCAIQASATSRASSTMAGSGSAGSTWDRAGSGSRRSSRRGGHPPERWYGRVKACLGSRADLRCKA